MAPPSDDCVVPVHGDPLPCGAEYDRQTAPQVTPRLRTPATVAKAQHKQRRSKRVPAVLDLINQLLLCAPTCPASKLQRHSLESLPRRKDRARASITFAAPSTHRARSRNHRQASIRRGAGATGAEAVQRPASLHRPWLLISCRLLLCMRAVCTTTTGTSRSPCA